MPTFIGEFFLTHFVFAFHTQLRSIDVEQRNKTKAQFVEKRVFGKFKSCALFQSVMPPRDSLDLTFSNGIVVPVTEKLLLDAMTNSLKCVGEQHTYLLELEDVCDELGILHSAEHPSDESDVFRSTCLKLSELLRKIVSTAQTSLNYDVAQVITVARLEYRLPEMVKISKWSPSFHEAAIRMAQQTLRLLENGSRGRFPAQKTYDWIMGELAVQRSGEWVSKVESGVHNEYRLAIESFRGNWTTMDAACTVIDISKSALGRLADNGEIADNGVKNRGRRFRRADIERYLEDHPNFEDDCQR